MAEHEINNVSQSTKNSIKEKTAYALPDRPSEQGFSPQKIKAMLAGAIIDNSLSAISEIDRVVDEINRVISDFDGNDELLFERVSSILLKIPNDASSSNKLATANDISSLQTLIDSIEALIPEGTTTSNKLANKTDITTLRGLINVINSLIPTQASASNQLADKQYVQEQQSTFRGTLNVVDDLGLTTSATHEDVEGALYNYAYDHPPINNNDIYNVSYPSSTVEGYFDKYEVYQFSQENDEFKYKYSIQNPVFSQAQWNAINSGIDEDKVAEFEGKQDELVSGENIKTVGGNSLLGSGDIPIASSFEDLEGEPTDNEALATELNARATNTALQNAITELKADIAGRANVIAGQLPDEVDGELDITGAELFNSDGERLTQEEIDDLLENYEYKSLRTTNNITLDNYDSQYTAVADYDDLSIVYIYYGSELVSKYPNASIRLGGSQYPDRWIFYSALSDEILLIPFDASQAFLNNYYTKNQSDLLFATIAMLADYVKFTDYATELKGGSIKVSNYHGTQKGSGASEGILLAVEKSYVAYNTAGNLCFIGKGTLENVMSALGINHSLNSQAVSIYNNALESKYNYVFTTTLTSLTITSFTSAANELQPTWQVRFKVGSGFTFSSTPTINWKQGTPAWSSLEGQEITILFEQSLTSGTYNAWVI